MNPSVAEMPPPERIHQRVHRRRMQDLGSWPLAGQNPIEKLALLPNHSRLLLLADFVTPFRMPPAELVGRDVLEHLFVVRGGGFVPGRGAAA